jgi:hypothetical protein
MRFLFLVLVFSILFTPTYASETKRSKTGCERFIHAVEEKDENEINYLRNYAIEQTTYIGHTTAEYILNKSEKVNNPEFVTGKMFKVTQYTIAILTADNIYDMCLTNPSNNLKSLSGNLFLTVQKKMK